MSARPARHLIRLNFQATALTPHVQVSQCVGNVAPLQKQTV